MVKIHNSYGDSRRDRNEKKREAVEALLMQGKSIRDTQAELGVSLGFVFRTRKKIVDKLPPCLCGRSSGHRGLCGPLQEKAKKRQKERYLARKKEAEPKKKKETVKARREKGYVLLVERMVRVRTEGDPGIAIPAPDYVKRSLLRKLQLRN